MVVQNIPKEALDLFPKWEYQCPKCGKFIEFVPVFCERCGKRLSDTQTECCNITYRWNGHIPPSCPNCLTPFDELKWRVPPRFLKNPKAMSEYAHKVLAPKLTEKQRALLFKYFTTIFEDGFESGDFSAWTGTSGAPAVAGNVVHHGTKSAEFDAVEYCYKTLSSTLATAYHRFYFRATELPDVNGEILTIARGYAGGTAIYQVAPYFGSGVSRWSFNYRNGAAWTNVPVPATININQWYCVELYWKLGAADGEVHLYIDGVDVVNVTAKDTDDYGNLDTIRNGAIEMTLGGEACTVYIDCVVVADAYIGPEEEAYYKEQILKTLPRLTTYKDQPLQVLPRFLDYKDQPFAGLPRLVSYAEQVAAVLPKFQNYKDQYIKAIVRALVVGEEIIKVLPRFQEYSDQLVIISPTFSGEVDNLIKTLPKYTDYIGREFELLPKLKSYTGQLIKVLIKVTKMKDELIKVLPQLKGHSEELLRLFPKFQVQSDILFNVYPTFMSVSEKMFEVLPRLKEEADLGIQIRPKLQSYYDYLFRVFISNLAFNEQLLRVLPRISSYEDELFKLLPQLVSHNEKLLKIIPKLLGTQEQLLYTSALYLTHLDKLVKTLPRLGSFDDIKIEALPRFTDTNNQLYGVAGIISYHTGFLYEVVTGIILRTWLERVGIDEDWLNLGIAGTDWIQIIGLDSTFLQEEGEEEYID